MSFLKIKGIPAQATPGDFGAVVSEAELMLPEEVAAAFASHGVRTAGEVVSYLHTYPSAIAQDLHWDVSDVMDGLLVLCDQLRGHVAEELLKPASHPVKGFGAVAPPGIKRRSST